MKESTRLLKHVAEFFNSYAPTFITSSAGTLKNYQDSLSVYFTWLEDVKGVTYYSITADSFSAENIREWVKWLTEVRGNSISSVNNRLGQLGAFLKFLGTKDNAWKTLYTDAKEIERKKPPKKHVSGMSEAAVTAILKQPDQSTPTGRRDLTMMVLQYGTATRVAEILNLKIKNVYLDNVPSPFIRIIGKGDKVGTCFLPPKATAHLRKYISEFHGGTPNPDAYVFYSPFDEPGLRPLSQDAYDKRIKKYGAMAGKKCDDVPEKPHSHQFRHARATHLIEHEVNVLEVSQILRHANVGTTMQYLDITIEEKAKQMAKVNGMDDPKVPRKWRKKDGSLKDFIKRTKVK